MTERVAPPDWGFDYRQDDPYEYDGWFGREQIAEPSSVDESPERPPSEPVDDVQEERYDPPPDVDHAPAPPPRRFDSPPVNTWTVNGQSTATSPSPPPATRKASSRSPA